MSRFDDLRNKMTKIDSDMNTNTDRLNQISNETARVSATAKNVHIIIEDIDSNFKKATKLNKLDISFLFLATALQCVRQYFLTNFKLSSDRPNDQAASKNTLFHGEEHSDRKHIYYNPSIEQIIANPVPFDTTLGSPDFNINIGGGTHRYKTLGHDPILGWVFGTANIATSTLTTWKFDSYHIKTVDKRDKIVKHADTSKILSSIRDKALHEGFDGKIKIGAALCKEAIHLRSDVSSKMSLPIPIIQTIDPKAAQSLAEMGIDSANLISFGKQITYSALINFLISMIHGLFYDETRDGRRSLYQVRTRKILLYSNTIASASNILAVAIMEGIGATTGNADLMKKGISYLDIGGFLVTLYRLITDIPFILRIKKEFLEKEFYNTVMGNDFDFMIEEE